MSTAYHINRVVVRGLVCQCGKRHIELYNACLVAGKCQGSCQFANKESDSMSLYMLYPVNYLLALASEKVEKLTLLLICVTDDENAYHTGA